MSKAQLVSTKERWKRVLYFFPFQLVWVHLKSNHLLLLTWLFLSGIITGNFLYKYGAYNLFLYPEYMGTPGFSAHFIIGFALGGLLVSFNLASYALNGIKFPLLATLNRPFYKYSLNNLIIPGIFFVLYFKELISYQRHEELLSSSTIALNILGILSGIALFAFIALFYFLSTNKNVYKLFGDLKIRDESHKARPVRTVFSKHEKWYGVISKKREWKVMSYISSPWRISLARDIGHYDGEMLRTVFAQNHINATVFELLTIASILFFGFYRETPLFKLPAAASMVLMLTMILMLVSAIYSWLKGWSTVVFVVLILSYNFISSLPQYSFHSFAYGLNYNHPTAYSNAKIKGFSRDTNQIIKDSKLAENSLNNWKLNNDSLYAKKPKLIILNCSGGGLRAAAWSMRVMQHLDSITNGTLMHRAHFITGSSGGMIGAAYFRELNFQQITDARIQPTNPSYFNNITNDLLNAVALNFSLHDWLLRIRQFDFAGYSYTKDRGYAFERQLSINTDYALNKRMADYRKPVLEADIPLMLMAPTITNDGRKLLIADLPVSYLTQTDYLDNLNHVGMVESVDYRQLLKDQSPDSLSFLSALRMNATFFYVLPNVLLPTTPQTEVMDAGIRDNYGTQHTLRYITHFLDWINENTSGVVIIQIRDRYKTVDIKSHANRSLVESFTRPIQVVSDNYLTIQSFNQDEMLMHMSGLLKDKISVINYQLKRTEQDNIALSWHLSNREKKRIYKSVYEPENEKSTEILIKLLEQQ